MSEWWEGGEGRDEGVGGRGGEMSEWWEGGEGRDE